MGTFEEFVKVMEEYRRRCGEYALNGIFSDEVTEDLLYPFSEYFSSYFGFDYDDVTSEVFMDAMDYPGVYKDFAPLRDKEGNPIYDLELIWKWKENYIKEKSLIEQINKYADNIDKDEDCRRYCEMLIDGDKVVK